MATPLDRALEILHQRLGLDLTGYRRPTLERRFAVRVAASGAADAAAYLGLLETEPGECQRLIGVLAVNVSSFFRDLGTFEALRSRVLPELLDRKALANASELRAWSAGCAAGEEAYSLAALLLRACRRARLPGTPLVFATDIDPEALARGRRGMYPREAFAETPLGILDEFFHPHPEGFEAGPALREVVRFSADDLTRSDQPAPAESVFGGFDLVACRNVLIYLEPALQARVLAKLVGSLTPGGLLVLGASEAPHGEALRSLLPCAEEQRIYQKTGGTLPVPRRRP